MKKYNIALALAISFISYSQQPLPDVLALASRDSALKDSINFNPAPIDFAFYSKNYKTLFRSSTVSLYNRNSGLNDVYLSYGNGLQYNTSKPILMNLPLAETYIDTFNPSGQKDILGALFSGVFGLLDTGFNYSSKNRIKINPVELYRNE